MLVKTIEELGRFPRNHGLIYCIYDKTSGQVGYVGLSRRPRTRWTDHRKEIMLLAGETLDTSNGIDRNRLSWAHWRLVNDGVLAMKALEIVSVSWMLTAKEAQWTKRFVFEGHPICNGLPMNAEWEAIILSNWPIFRTAQ